jgi:NitT/TauT family transport system ATP-binding protein
MFQADSLLPWLSARDNVALGPQLRGAEKAASNRAALAWLDRVGLHGHGLKYPHQLSGGMKKRVSMAQCLITEPRILLMDEPFSALDVQTRQLMENELLDIWTEKKMSVMFVTHDLEEAISLSDRVIVMSSGPASSIVAEFPVDIPRPRDVTEIVQSPEYLNLQKRIWDRLKVEVLKNYRNSKS